MFQNHLCGIIVRPQAIGKQKNARLIKGMDEVWVEVELTYSINSRIIICTKPHNSVGMSNYNVDIFRKM
ncbi:MAG: hypothetical protein WCJ58_07965 [bacterium]